MCDIVAAWTYQGWCDACETNIEAQPHEPGCPIAEIERIRADNERLRKILFTPVESGVCTISVSETDERRIKISVEYNASVPFWGEDHFVADTIADCALLMLEEYSEDVRRALEWKDE